jgi:hypothetical protein
MSDVTHAKGTPSGESRDSSMSSHHGLISAMRARRESLQAIADALQAVGVEANRGAVDRYCRKHGIPLGEPVRVGQYTPFTVEQTAGGDDAVPSQVRADGSTDNSDTKPSSSTVERSAPVEVNDPRDIATARLLREVGEWVARIEAVKASGDKAELERVLRESVVWLGGYTELVPPTIVEHVRKGIADTETFLRNFAGGQHSAGIEPKPFIDETQSKLFEPLARLPVWTPDLPLVNLNGTDPWTLQDACEGTLILGATGSGKTSGSGQLLARSFLTCGFGGLILTTKADDADRWRCYAESTGRLGQFCQVRSGSAFAFNFLDYQASLPDDAGGSTENVVELLFTILDAASGTTRKADGQGAFWANTARQLLRNLVRIVRASGERLTLDLIRRFLVESPQSLEEVQAGTWKGTPTFGRLLGTVEQRRVDERDIGVCEAMRYWLHEFPALNAKTRSIIITDLTATVDMFFDPALAELLCGKTTITPDDVLDGAILVIDLPTEKWLHLGRIAQLVFKIMFQSAVRRRTDADDATRRPVFLFVDEFQNFLTESDATFVATSRAARCATVFLTQSLPGLYMQAGSTLPREKVAALTANLNTKVFHANADPQTNTWASEQIGKSMQYRASVSHGGDELDAKGVFKMLLGVGRSRVTSNPAIDFEVQPSAFTKLKTGSARNNHIVEAIVCKSGGQFTNGKHYMTVAFVQEA